MGSNDPRAQVEPGDGIAFRSGPVTLLAFPTTGAQDAALDILFGTVDEVINGGDSDIGRKLVRRLVGYLARADVDGVPDFGLVVSGPTTAVLVNGDVDIVARTPQGVERMSGRSVSSWLDRVLDSDVDELTLHRSGQDGVQPTRRSDLRAGSVAASGVILSTRGVVASEPSFSRAEPVDRPAEAESSTEPTPEDVGPSSGATAPVAAPSVVVEPLTQDSPSPEPPPPAGAEPSFVSIGLSEPQPEQVLDPLPIATEAEAEAGAETGVEVSGILCSRQHFNDPASSFCSTCGISMVHQTHNLVRGRRPPLGVLLADDGAAFALDGDYVIGREPEDSELVRSGLARALALPDPERTISRAHARVMLDQWDVRVVDLRSANGTHVAGPDQTEWTTLHPEEPATLKPGSRVLVGQRTFVYDSHHRH